MLEKEPSLEYAAETTMLEIERILKNKFSYYYSYYVIPGAWSINGRGA